MDHHRVKHICQQIDQTLDQNGVHLWGLADLSGMATPVDNQGRQFPRAVAFAVAMDPSIMAGITGGPTSDYAAEYERVNRLIDALSEKLVKLLLKAGVRAYRLASSKRTDPVNIKGDFPHKTAATRAGLGWIGKNCQLITKKQGPWVRLGTVFTDLDASCANPMDGSRCGRCAKCVEACPAGALAGAIWKPGMAREKILDPGCCDRWKKTHYMQFHDGHNCGICAAVCPFGR